MSEPTSAAMGLRGVALVEHVIAEVEAGRAWMEIEDPQPAPNLDTLCHPNGAPLSPSLRRWLAFDGSWIDLDEFDLTENAATLTGLLDWMTDGMFDEPGDSGASPDLDLIGHILPGQGSEQARILVPHAADDNGEHPILVIDVGNYDNHFSIWSPGFDVWLAEIAGCLDWEREHTEAMRSHPHYATATTEAWMRLLNATP